MVAPETIAKLRLAFNDVRPDEPEAQPFLTGLEDFLRRWFGINFGHVDAFEQAFFTLCEEAGRLDVEVCGKTWCFDCWFIGFGIEGLLGVNIPQDVLENSLAYRRYQEEDAKHEDEMDLIFKVTRNADGQTEDDVWVVRADRNG